MLALGAHGPAAEGGRAVWGGPWLNLWNNAPIFGRWLAASFAVTTVSVLFHLLADAMAGYVLAKRSFRGRAAVFTLILLAMMVPRQVTLIPLFLGMAHAGLADTFAGLVLPGAGRRGRDFPDAPVLRDPARRPAGVGADRRGLRVAGLPPGGAAAGAPGAGGAGGAGLSALLERFFSGPW